MGNLHTKPGTRHILITPNDDTVLDPQPNVLWIGTGGDIVLTDDVGHDETYTVPSGYILRFSPVKVKATGTTALNIKGWW